MTPRGPAILLFFGLTLGCTAAPTGSAGSAMNGGDNGGTRGGQGPTDVGGYAVYSHLETVDVLELATGRLVEKGIKFSVWPSLDAQVWAGYDSNTLDATHVSFYDASLQLTRRADFPAELHGLTQVSPDHSRIATFFRDAATDDSYANPPFTIFDLDANVLARNPNVTASDWMPDGRLLYAEGGTIYVGDSLGKNGARIDSVYGVVGHLAVRSDGRRIAFEVRETPGIVPTGPTNDADAWAHVWVMSFDGSGTRRLTTSAQNEVNPEWIGETDLLLVTQGVTEGIPARLYVVPTNPSLINLTEFGDASPARLVRQQARGYNGTEAATPWSAVAWLSSM